MTPTIFDTAVNPNAPSTGQQLSGGSIVDFSDLLFSVSTESVQIEEQTISEEPTEQEPTNISFSIPPTPLLPPIEDAPTFSEPELSAGPASVFMAETLNMISADLPSPFTPAARSIAESSAADAAQPISDIGDTPHFLPAATKKDLSLVPEPDADRRPISMEESISPTPSTLAAPVMPYKSTRLTDAYGDQTQQPEGHRIEERKPFESFWQPIGEGSPKQIKDPFQKISEAVLTTLRETVSPDDDVTNSREAAGLTETILGRFEIKRVHDTSIVRPEAPLPVELRTIGQVVDQLVTFIPTHLGKEGKEILKMRLHPAELGHLEIEIERDAEGSISAQIRTEKSSTQHILIEGLNELRDSLRDAGIDVGVLEVTTSATSSGEQESRDTGSRHPGVRERVDDTFVHADIDHEDAEEDRLVSLRA